MIKQVSLRRVTNLFGNKILTRSAGFPYDPRFKSGAIREGGLSLIKELQL